jgi:hypothetical protein
MRKKKKKKKKKKKVNKKNTTTTTTTTEKQPDSFVAVIPTLVRIARRGDLGRLQVLFDEQAELALRHLAQADAQPQH